MTHVSKGQVRPGKESIHSGHFMVSHFEAEEQDDYDDIAVPTKTNITQMESFQRYKAPVEGQD
ncbi:unnamed protein product [Leptidea sinapis]|uniref:Uncharacterized protein n=1 Tax=Leptidea sinapis TaxID=189913 RepID=A0A5E4R2M7_9NEOP|nr:unnamed protein product [Leptidea sinapis]